LAYRQGKTTKCPCGSGKKYKNCCQKTTLSAEAFHDLRSKFMNGELPFRAEIHSKDGGSASMKVSSASVDIGNGEKTLFKDEITLSTNSSVGDAINDSFAQITIPVNSYEEPSIVVGGNASVKNESPPYSIAIAGNLKKLKIKSGSGLFAVIRVAKQRDTGVDYFDVLFGSKGQKETNDESGSKNRPHIAFYPEGNSKFIRLSNYACELTNKLSYDPKGKEIYPSSLEIHSNSHREAILLEFQFNSGKRLVVLKRATFKNKT
jgi:hypothetical protein